MPEAGFLQDVERAIELYEEEIGHAATRTRQMIEQYGVVEALSRLMVSADLQQGFKVLPDSDQLDKTFEAVVGRYIRVTQLEPSARRVARHVSEGRRPAGRENRRGRQLFDQRSDEACDRGAEEIRA